MVPEQSTARTPTVTLDEVEAVLAVHVMPYIRNHGGDLHVTDIDEDGTVVCRLEGACRSCPAAAVTVIAVVERALRDNIDSSITVRAPQIGVSQAAVDRIRKFYPKRASAHRRN